MNEKAHQSFTEREVWEKERELNSEIAELVKSFPPEEKFRLPGQVTRSSGSVNSSFPGGHGPYTFRDRLFFCIRARDSLGETCNHLTGAPGCKFINEKQRTYYKSIIDKVEKLLNGYIACLRKNV